MQRLPPVLTACALAALLWARPGAGGPGDNVYALTRHGNTTSGVNRTGTLPVGHCAQCHPVRTVSAPGQLFGPNDNTLCLSCHDSALGIFPGQTTFESTRHSSSGVMLWPGPAPAARPSGDQGKCLNCHTPHGARDGLGLVPDLGHVREEQLCLACHDGSGPASVNLAAELARTRTHPITSWQGRHVAGEAGGAAFSGTSRHVECADCHNPHAVQTGAASSATTSQALRNVSRVAVTNGAANTAPSYTLLGAQDATPASEWQVCFKCHSGYATLPAGAKDKGVELNPANASFHPVEAAGKNATAAMANSLAGGTGNPKLTTSSVLWCSDCHSSDAIPTTVSQVGTWDGGVPAGPHGSSAGDGTARYSSALLRARYRVQPLPTATADNYTAADFAFCFLCHAAAPFADRSKNARSDTNFKFHGFHMRDLFNKGGNPSCNECHESIHGTALAAQSTNRTYSRLVAYGANLTGPTGTGAPTWTPGSCNVRCHGQAHENEGY